MDELVAASGGVVLFTYAVLALHLRTHSTERFYGGLADRTVARFWLVSAVATVASYLVIAFNADDKTNWALVAFNICATLWAPLIIAPVTVANTDGAVIAVRLTAIASMVVAFFFALSGPSPAELLAPVVLVFHHVFFDAYLWTSDLPAA